MFCFILEGEISSTRSLWATCAARVVALASEPLLIMSLRGSPRMLFPQLPSTTARVVRARPPRVRTRVVASVAAVTTVTAQQVLPYRGRARGEKNSYEDPKIHLLRSFSSASISTSPSFLRSFDGFSLPRHLVRYWVVHLWVSGLLAPPRLKASLLLAHSAQHAST